MTRQRTSPQKPIARSRLVVGGIVQGVGFRPFIHRLAHAMGLNGWVLNSTEGVVIEVEGKSDVVDRFVRAIPEQAPPAARVERINRAPLPPIGYTSFAIEPSQEVDGRFALVSPDLCVCEDCLREMRDPSDRRYRYPFINCTNCGPRFTIVADVPYDRSKTTMGCFPMCPDCEREYHDPANRRFHAQPNACPVCGPRVWLVEGGTDLTPLIPFPTREEGGRSPLPRGEGQGEGRAGGTPNPAVACKEGSVPAIQRAQDLLTQGKILAVKGLGGFHLACDATNETAVAELRRRKRRSDKPFALMAIDADTVATFCHLSDEERQLLESPQRPIVLLRRKTDSPIAPSVAPGNCFLGVMLPYTPLHYLLLERDTGTRGHGDAEKDASSLGGGANDSPLPEGEGQGEGVVGGGTRLPSPRPSPTAVGEGVLASPSPRGGGGRGVGSAPAPYPSSLVLVMTSGNLSEEPIATGNREALERLASLADAFLLHDRDIQLRCDDSVTRVFRGKEAVIRRSRGYAPFPVRLGVQQRDVLACGGELKSTFCITKGDYAFLSQHIGDLENAETLESYRESVEHFRKLFRLDIEAVAHDLHPEYLSTRYAWELAEGGSRLPLVPVQHHHAHIAACMAENGVDETVLGVAFDGTGYGADGHLWGGEFLVADYAGYRRAAHLEYLPLPGGEAAIKRPYRMTLSYLLKALGPDLQTEGLPPLKEIGQSELGVLRRQIERGINSPLTSSVGRLFDAVSSLVGVRQVVNYEGQAAIELEMAADQAEGGLYPWTLIPGEPRVIDPAPAIRGIVDDIRRGTPVGTISARFHNTVADMVALTCQELRAETGLTTVALSGGVFQNLFLLERVCRRLEAMAFRVLLHHQVPANDGCIALGQAVVANRVLSSGG